MLTRGPLLLQDNAPAHTAQITLAAAVTQNIEILPHPVYSPDLSPCDFHLFPNLKKSIKGKRFETDNDVIDACEEWFLEPPKLFYSDGMHALFKRWEKCIQLAGDYIEKI